jgi:hypothetical protein
LDFRTRPHQLLIFSEIHDDCIWTNSGVQRCLCQTSLLLHVAGSWHAGTHGSRIFCFHFKYLGLTWPCLPKKASSFIVCIGDIFDNEQESRSRSVLSELTNVNQCCTGDCCLHHTCRFFFESVYITPEWFTCLSHDFLENITCISREHHKKYQRISHVYYMNIICTIFGILPYLVALHVS